MKKDKINGFIQIDSFFEWVIENSDKVRSSHISLYCFLWRQNNRLMWIEWFKCPFELAMIGSGIGSKTTYYKSLDDLKSWGLIDYKKGQNNYSAPSIKLFYLSKNGQLTEQLTGQLTVQHTGKQSGQLTVPIDKQTNNKHKTTNNKISLSEIEDKLFELGEPYISADIKSYYDKAMTSGIDLRNPISYIQTMILNSFKEDKFVRKPIEKPKFVSKFTEEENKWH